MKLRTRPLRAILATCAALLALPAAAPAAEYCVAPASGCADGTFDEFDTAITLAQNNAGRDTIRLGEKTYSKGSHFLIGSPVDLVGAGVGKTVVTTTGTSYSLYFQPGAIDSVVSDLTVVKADSAVYGLVLYSSHAEDIEVIGTDTPNGEADTDWWIYLNGGNANLTNVKVLGQLGPARFDWAVRTSGGTHVFNNVDLTGDNAVVQHGGTVTINRSRLRGHRTYVINQSGTANINTSVVRTDAGSSPTPMALQSVAANAAVSTLNLKESTVVGNGSGFGVRAEYGAAGCPQSGNASATIESSTVSEFGTGSWQQGGCVGASYTPDTCPAPPGGSNRLQWTNSHYTGGTHHSGGCRGNKDLQFGTPGFVSATDLRPRQPSPLIDNGSTTADSGGEVDLNGAPRVVDGDGTGGPRRDIGAFEYQRKPPTVSASVDPPAGVVNSPFAFSAAASDPDGESLQYIWTFSDGQALSGANVSKAFATAASHSGTVQAIDGSGLSSTATAAVTVTSGVVPPPPPPPPPVDTTAPAVTVKGGKLSVNRKRKAKVTITCPATETAPCQIAIAVSSAKKILLGGKRKRIASLGKGSGSVANGRTATVTITLTKKAYRYLKRKRKLPAKLAVTARDAAGNSAKASASVTLRAAKK